MKKAAIYARVSSEHQKKDKTIDSQVLVLKKQVADSGDVLVKEYIDNGYSGARLDRPALDQMRKDLKTNTFDVIYFHNTDRIARDTNYQTLIIAEILKSRKQIIINGKDYVHNPENKFALTVLGAVAELERAKIIERTSRGRAMRLAQGQLVGGGHNIYGYDFTKKTSTNPPILSINPKEARIVKYIFTTYAKGRIGMNQITRRLERMKIATKAGKKLWRISLLKKMLKNEAYRGIRYFNTVRRVREYANPLFGIKHSTSTLIKRDKSEWVGVKIPAIISQSLFDKIQERLAWNRKHYRNPKQVQLLSSLIRCGECGGSFFAYRRYYKDIKNDGSPYAIHRTSYSCNWRLRQIMHSKQSNITRCHNPQVKAEYLENCVFEMIRETMLDKNKIRTCMDFFKEKGRKAQLKLEGRLKKIEHEIMEFETRKRRIIDVYASCNLTKTAYIKKCLEYDNEINELKRQRSGLIGRIPLVHKTEVIDTSINQFCETAWVRFTECKDFSTKRQFLLDYVEKIIFLNDKVSVFGSVPIITKGRTDESEQTAKIDFKIDGRVKRPSKSTSR
jgi:site-specific DNA recombinase